MNGSDNGPAAAARGADGDSNPSSATGGRGDGHRADESAGDATADTAAATAANITANNEADITAVIEASTKAGAEAGTTVDATVDATAAVEGDTAVLDAVIVGGGPVGLGLAIELGQRGLRVVLVERHRQPQPVPKGQNLTQRTMEHMRAWGAETALRAARTVPAEYGIGGLTAYGTLLGAYHYDWLQRELVRPFYATANERLPQYATEAVLRRRVAALPSVRTLYGWDAEAVAQDCDGVTVTLVRRDGDGVHKARPGDGHDSGGGDGGGDDGGGDGGHGDRHGDRDEPGSADTGRRRTLRAAYAVGCDGSRSAVRAEAGIPQTLTDHDRRMVLLVFRSTELHTLLERYPGKSYYNVLHPDLQGYWKFFGRVDLGTTWFFHAPVAPGTTADNADFAALLHHAVGAPFALEITYVGFWDLRFALAERYRAGRVFIAGDAAHSHPPYGGYGINAGLEDARNLGWKLAAVRQGWGGEALLDSYDAERRPVFRSTIDDFIARAIETDRAFLAGFDPAVDRAAFEREWQVRAQGAVGEVHAFEPHYEGSSAVVPPPGAAHGVCSARGAHRFEARAGHHLAPARLADGGDVCDRLGTGFTLLAFGAGDAAVAAWRDAAAARGVPLAVVRRPRGDSKNGGDTGNGNGSETEGRGATPRETDRYAARLVLVRPDQFVAWAGDDCDGSGDAATARRVLATVCGADENERRQ